MTDKEKLIKIKSLADKMSDTAFNMTTNASLLKKAMDEYHQFIINEYHKEEQVIKELQEEPVIEKKCMFTKDNYTDEDRKVLCEDCKEECEYNKEEEPVSDDEIEKQFKVGDIVVYMSRHPAYSGLYLLGNPNDLSIGYSNANEPYQIALRNCTIASEDEHIQFMRELNDNGYKWNEVTLRIDKKEEPVSEELEKAAVEAFKQIVDDERNSFLEIFKAGARWQEAKDKQVLNEEGVVVLPEEAFERMKRSLIELAEKEQMMANAIDVTVHIDAGGYPYLPQMELYDYDKDVPLAKEGDKYNVVLIKEG